MIERATAAVNSMERVIGGLLLGDSAVMRQLRARIARIAGSGLPVLIQGPTGAGKELVAQALHLASGRSGELVPFNVCAIAEPMFEDALFGHVRGAFTGAIGDTRGYLTEAHRGTLFLDEISGLAMASQSKLLRALETRCFRPVGARHDHTSDFRIVAATNERIDALVAEKRFRADLSYRLSACVITVPALRDHPEDVRTLAAAFLPKANGGAAQPMLTEAAHRLLERYDWPGNVRELRNTIECAAALATSSVIGRDEIAACHSSAGPRMARLTRLPTRRLLQVLDEAQWNIDVAASVLGVHRATIYRRLKRSQLLRPTSVSGDEGDASGGTPQRTDGQRPIQVSLE